jgi:hypothetical protein
MTSVRIMFDMLKAPQLAQVGDSRMKRMRTPLQSKSEDIVFYKEPYFTVNSRVPIMLNGNFKDDRAGRISALVERGTRLLQMNRGLTRNLKNDT